MKKILLRVLLIFIIYNLSFVISASKIDADDCPSGYTCPDTSYKAEYGETLPVERQVPKSSLNISGNTGPELNQIKFPELQEENKFLSSPEFFDRALPAKLRDELKFATPSALNATLAHTGCGKVTVNGQEVGNVSVDPAKTKFSSTPEYTNLLLVSRFWQSIFVPGKGSTLKFKALQPDGDPNVPSSLADCINNSGESLQATKIENTPPAPLSFLSGLLGAIGDFLNKIVGNTVLVKFNIEQSKYLPGETALEDQTVGDSGFLNSFKPASVKYTKEGAEKENVPYVVLNQPETHGVIFAEANSIQSGTTIDLPNSLFPANLGGGIISSPNVQTPIISGKLDFTIPYRDTSVTISEDRKQSVMRQVKIWHADTQIESLWDAVVSSSLAHGINPAFTLAIWIEESAASSRLANAASPFGCFPNGDTTLNVSFGDSLDCFIHFTEKEHASDFVEWIRNFCGPQADPICSNNPNFIGNFRRWYDQLVPPGSPGAAQQKQ